MAKSDKVVKRGVYLYLDGSEIKNDIKSVETEMKGLISAQKKMTLGSEEYVRAAQKIRTLKGIISEHNAQLRETEANVKKNTISVGKLADGFNRFFGLIGAGLAALTGFTLAIRTLRDEKNKLEESQAGLKALTGLDDESIAWLTGQAKTLSTTMTKEGLRVRQSANEILDAYMLIGSAKPELLGNKEALASVTEEAMRLQAAAKDITLNEAVDALTLSLNQYSEGADKAAQFTNVLAAGSQAGSANIASEAKAIRVAGVAAASANTSIEQTVGLIQTLAYRGIKDEIAGTGLKKFFLTLQTGSDDTNPKIVGLTTALDNLQKKQMDAAAIKKMFGEEGYNVASVLISETAQVKEFTKAVTGTNIATEQAAINSNTAAAKLAQAKNELKLAGIELADRLNPAISVSTNMVTNLIKYLPGLIDWFKEWGSTIALSLAPVLLYNGAIKLMNAYHIIANGLRTVSTTLIILHTAAVANSTGNLVRYNTAMSAYNLMLNANSRLVKFCTGLTYLFAAAKATLAGNTVKAGIAMKAFQALGMTNVFVAIATAVLAAGIAIYKLSTRTTEAQKAVKQFQEESERERISLRGLIDAAVVVGDKTKRRKELIEEINSKYGQYLPNLLNEYSSLKDIEQAYLDINKAMDQNIARKVLDEKTNEIKNEALTDQVDEMNDIRKSLEGTLAPSQINDYVQKLTLATEKCINAGNSVENTTKAVLKNLNSYYRDKSEIPTYIYNKLEDYVQVVEKTAKRVKAVKSEMLPFLGEPVKEKNVYEAPEVIVTAKDLSKKNNGGSGSGNDDAKKNKIKRIEDEALAKRVALMAEYAIGKKDYQAYQEELRVIEAESISKQMALYKKGSAEYNSLREKQLNADIEKSRYAAEQNLELLEWSYNEDVRWLDEQQASGQISKKVYNEMLLDLDIDYLTSKRNLYSKGSKEYEQVEKEIGKRLADDQLNRQKETLDKIAELREKYQVKSLREMYDIEMADLKLALDTKILTYEKYEKAKSDLRMKYAKQGMNPDDQESGTEQPDKKNISFSDALFGDLGDKRTSAIAELKKAYEEGAITTEEYLQGMSESWGTYLAGVSEKVEAAYAVISGIVSSYSNYLQASQEADIAKVEQRYDAEIEAAGNNSAKTKRLEEKKEKEIAKIKSEYAERAFGIQVAQALAQTAIGAINAFSSAAAIPIVGYVLAPIAAAAALASGMLQVAAIEKQREAAKAGYMVGGFTPHGRPDEEQGAVHSNEFVANRFAVSNPQLRPLFNLLDYAQRNNSVANLTAEDVASVVGRSNSKNGNSSSSVASEGRVENDNTALMAALYQSAEVIEKLRKRLNEPFTTINVVEGPYGIQKAMDEYNKLKRNKSRQ